MVIGYLDLSLIGKPEEGLHKGCNYDRAGFRVCPVTPRASY